MKGVAALGFAVVLLITLLGRVQATACDNNCGDNYGLSLAVFDGVDFNSNGDCTGTCRGLYQCVAGVKFFYANADGFDNATNHVISTSWPAAKDAFGASNPYLTAYANGATTSRPQVGDVLCFGTAPNVPDNYGHVGIISKVVADANGNGHVYMIDQNRTSDVAEITLPLQLKKTGSYYSVASIGKRYVTQGWLRHSGYVAPNSDPTPTPPAITTPPPTTYTNLVSTQEPYGISLLPGQMADFSVTYINTGSGTWKGGATSTGDANYTELRACSSTGTVQPGWLYYSGTGGWLTSSHIASCNETTVAQLESATFDFNVIVPLTQSPGVYRQYFRVHHNTGDDLQTPSGAYNVCYVEVTVLDATRYQAFTGKFNTDTKSDVGVWDKVNGDFSIAVRNGSSNRFDASGYWLEGWHPGAIGDTKLLVADFSGDGYSDIGLYQPSTGNWYVAFNQGGYFQSSTGPGTGGAWITGWGQGSGYIPLAADFSGDGAADIAAYYPSLGRWWVAYNQSSTNGGFQQHNGPATNSSWITGWATEDGNGWRPFAADVSGDGYADVVAYSPLYGRWFVAYNQGGYFQNASGPATNGSWVTSWATEDGSQWRCFVTDLSGDGYADLLAYTPLYGRWFVAYNQGGYFNGQSGPATNGSWLTSWDAEHDGYQWQLLTGDVSGDGVADLVGYTPAWGRWFVAYNQGGYFNGESGTQTGGSWLDNWGKLGTGTPLGQGTSSAGFRSGPPQPTLPTQFSLTQAPNPFTGLLRISYALPHRARVRLGVYNVAGRHVATVLDQDIDAGTNTAVWDASSAPPGIYFYRFVAGEFSATRRIVLLK